jgi:hypothetical protein
VSRYICFTNLKHLIFWNGGSTSLMSNYSFVVCKWEWRYMMIFTFCMLVPKIYGSLAAQIRIPSVNFYFPMYMCVWLLYEFWCLHRETFWISQTNASFAHKLNMHFLIRYWYIVGMLYFVWYKIWCRKFMSCKYEMFIELHLW